MKTAGFILMTMFAAAVWTACSDTRAEGRYIDLSTGEPVELVEDTETGRMVHAETRKPVRMYVDTRTNDTIWGASGAVINGNIRRTSNGAYLYVGSVHADDDATDYKYKQDGRGYKLKIGDDYKKKVEDDGDYKIKDGNVKIKVDAETGKRKVKRDD